MYFRVPPFSTYNVAKSSHDKRESGVAIREVADNSRAMTNFAHHPFHGIIRTDLAPVRSNTNQSLVQATLGA